jgi:hypothetical protein
MPGDGVGISTKSDTTKAVNTAFCFQFARRRKLRKMRKSKKAGELTMKSCH